MHIGMKQFQGSGEEDDDEHAAFPTLEKALELIDPHGGFNIEIKWDMERKVWKLARAPRAAEFSSFSIT